MSAPAASSSPNILATSSTPPRIGVPRPTSSDFTPAPGCSTTTPSDFWRVAGSRPAFSQDSATRDSLPANASGKELSVEYALQMSPCSTARPMFRGAMTGKHDRYRTSTGPERCVDQFMCRVIHAGEGHLFTANQRNDHLEGLFISRDGVPLRQAKRLPLDTPVSRPQAEYESTTADLVESRRDLGGDSSVAVKCREDPGADLDG